MMAYDRGQFRSLLAISGFLRMLDMNVLDQSASRVAPNHFARNALIAFMARASL